MIGSRKRKTGSRVRFRLWETTFCLDTISNYQKDQDKLAFPSSRVRLAFGALLELSSEALALARGLGRYHRVQWSGLVCDG